MAWEVTYVVSGQRIGVISGFGYSRGPCLSLLASTISNCTDEEIVNIARWFLEHSSEIYAIHTGDECYYDPQFISGDELRLIIDGNLASDSDKEKAFRELQRRQNGDPAINPYVEYKRQRKQKKPGYVYLAHSETDHYKIGKSLGPEDRIAVFDTQMPIAVSMIHAFEADNMAKAESELHQRYADKRVKGEWFDLDEIDIEWISNIDHYKGGIFYPH